MICLSRGVLDALQLDPSPIDHDRESGGVARLNLAPPHWGRRSRRNFYGAWEARCSASHCSLIRPRGAAFLPPGASILGMITIAITTDKITRPTMKSIGISPQSGLSQRELIVPPRQTPVCALVHNGSSP